MAWFEKNRRYLPWRAHFQKHRDPYAVWVSEVMLQQTQISAVIPKYEAFMKALPSVESLASAHEETLRLLTSGMGYYRRFKFLHEGARQISKRGEFPSTHAELLKIKGIGEYTASAVASICFNEPEAVVDGNVERIMCRLFDIRLPPNLPALKPAFKKTLNQIIDRKAAGSFNEGIMELGQRVCKPQNPLCKDCPLTTHCLSHKNDSQHLAPAKKEKKAFKKISLHVQIPQDRCSGKILLPKRSAESRFLKDMRGFEMIEIKQPDEKRELKGTKKENLPKNKFPTFNHTITNHKLTVSVEVTAVQGSQNKEMNFYSKSEILDNVESSFDKKALKTCWDQL